MRTSVICRRWTVGVLGAIAVCAVTMVSSGCGQANVAGPAAGASSTGAASAPTAGPSSPDTSPAPAPVGAGCRAADLAYQSKRPGAAAGNYYVTVTLVNHGSGSCQLAGMPGLFATDGSGATQPVPAIPDTTGTPPYTVGPGGSVQFIIHTVDGYGGYDPTSPQCAHPMTYRGLSVELSGGRVPLGDVTIDLKCGDIRIIGWGASQPQ